MGVLQRLKLVRHQILHTRCACQQRALVMGRYQIISGSQERVRVQMGGFLEHQTPNNKLRELYDIEKRLDEHDARELNGELELPEDKTAPRSSGWWSPECAPTHGAAAGIS